MIIKITIPDAIYTCIQDTMGKGYGGGRVQLVEKFRISDQTARFYLKAMAAKEAASDPGVYAEIESIKVEGDYKQGVEGSVRVEGRTLAHEFSEDGAIKAAMDKAKINPDEWTVDKVRVNHWDVTMKLRRTDGTDEPTTVTNWAVAISLLPNRAKPLFEAMRAVIDELKPIPRPVKVKPVRDKVDPGLAYELIPADAHFMKYAWGEETLSGNMDTDIVQKMFEEATDAELDKARRFHPSKIFFVLGNDILHTEQLIMQTTKSKHPLDGDGRFQRGAWACLRSLIRLVEKCVTIAPTRVVWIPGNHDYLASWWLAETLRQRYLDHPDVFVDNSPSPHKSVLWGKLLVGWTHAAVGAKANRSINSMPHLWAEKWGKSKYRELHVGDKHHSLVTKFTPVNTLGGAVIRQVAGLTAPDFWHADNMFLDGVPACESFLWHKEQGVIASFITNIDYTK